jgi:hypothetical protein
MKKLFLGLAAFPMLAMLATSCGKEMVETNNDHENIINFGVATGKQTVGTRAAEADITTLRSDPAGLTVKSYQADGTPYRDFVIQYSTWAGNSADTGSGWSYQTPVLHPAFEVKHFSVWPTTMNTSLAYDGSQATFGYDVAGNVDLMVASATTTQATQASATAPLIYKHILSQINFAIAGGVGAYIHVQNISIGGIPSVGTYTFGSSNIWSSLSDRRNHAYTPAESAQTTGVADEIVYLGNHTGGTSKLDYSNGLMMIPHALGAGETLSFEFQMTDDLGNSLIPEGELTGTNSEWKPVTVDLAGLGEIAQWDASKRYIYILNFETPHFIRFTVDVDPLGWQDYDNNGGVVDVQEGEDF